MLAGGATETQVIDAFVVKYGERILAAPKPRGFNLLAYVMPAVGFAVGFLIVALVMRRQRSLAPSAVPSPEVPDQLKAQFEKELARFDQ